MFYFSYSQSGLGTNFGEILIKIQNFVFTKVQLKTSSTKLRPFGPGEMSYRNAPSTSLSEKKFDFWSRLYGPRPLPVYSDAVWISWRPK